MCRLIKKKKDCVEYRIPSECRRCGVREGKLQVDLCFLRGWGPGREPWWVGSPGGPGAAGPAAAENGAHT